MFISLVAAFLLCQGLRQEPEPAPAPELMRVTCYTATGNCMANGEMPYEGCVAGKKEDIGKKVKIYDLNMNLIGEYEIKDTGGKLIRTGQRIDVYRDTLSRCFDWVHEYGDYLYIEIEQ